MIQSVRYLTKLDAFDRNRMEVRSPKTIHFEDLLPSMAEKLGGEGLIAELWISAIH